MHAEMLVVRKPRVQVEGKACEFHTPDDENRQEEMANPYYLSAPREADRAC